MDETNEIAERDVEVRYGGGRYNKSSVMNCRQRLATELQQGEIRINRVELFDVKESFA